MYVDAERDPYAATPAWDGGKRGPEQGRGGGGRFSSPGPAQQQETRQAGSEDEDESWEWIEVAGVVEDVVGIRTTGTYPHN